MRRPPHSLSAGRGKSAAASLPAVASARTTRILSTVSCGRGYGSAGSGSSLHGTRADSHPVHSPPSKPPDSCRWSACPPGRWRASPCGRTSQEERNTSHAPSLPVRRPRLRRPRLDIGLSSPSLLLGRMLLSMLRPMLRHLLRLWPRRRSGPSSGRPPDGPAARAARRSSVKICSRNLHESKEMSLVGTPVPR